jgi:hypothetical protein
MDISKTFSEQQIGLLAKAAHASVQRSEAVEKYLYAQWHSRVKAAEVAPPNEIAFRMAEVRVISQIYGDLFNEQIATQSKKW